MTSDQDLAGSTMVVTGANTGIGRATALALASRGARVILACRSAEPTASAMAEITAVTGNAELEYLPLDLADLASARAAARTLADRAEPVHAVVANAGVAGQRGQTAQGFELAFGVNHLGHFAFVTGLLGVLEAAATPGSPARVVVVSSDSHYQARLFTEVDVRRPTRSITGLPEYARSKLANVVFTQELARRLDPGRVTANAVHPGVIASDIWRRVPRPVRAVMTRRMASTTDGARTQVWCATEPSLATTTGKYFADCTAKAPSERATAELGRWLWDHSEQWVSAVAQP